MPEEFNETLILLGKLVGSKSQPKTIHIDFASEAKIKKQIINKIRTTTTGLTSSGKK